jgi:hypothetical protein
MRAFAKVILALTAALMAAPAFSQVQLQQAAAGGPSGPEPMPVHAWIGLTTSVGSGTFATEGFYNPTVQSSFSLTPMIMYKGWQVLVNQNIGFEWTQADGNTYAHELELSDTTFGVRNLALLRFPDAKVSFWPSVNYAAPLSMASRQAGSLGTFSGAFRGNYNGLSDIGLTIFGGVNAGYTVLAPGLSQSFANSDVKPVDSYGQSIVPVSCNVRSTGELANYACLDGGLPSVARWGASLGAWWFYLLDGNLGFSANLGYTQSFSVYGSKDDQYTADAAITGLVPRQNMSSDLSMTYMPTGWLWLSLGASTQQPFLSADGTRMRFPLWDFESASSNFSSLYFDATFAL